MIYIFPGATQLIGIRPFGILLPLYFPKLYVQHRLGPWGKQVKMAAAQDTLGPMMNAVNWTLTALAGTFLGLRMYCKFSRHRGLWWDDHILIFAWVSDEISTSVVIRCFLTYYGDVLGMSHRRCRVHHQLDFIRIYQPGRASIPWGCPSTSNPRRCTECVFRIGHGYEQDLIRIYANESHWGPHENVCPVSHRHHEHSRVSIHYIHLLQMQAGSILLDKRAWLLEHREIYSLCYIRWR